MSCKIIDGKPIASQILERVKARAVKLKEKHGIIPTLGIILANNNPASEAYVRHKVLACKAVGIQCSVWQWRNPRHWERRYPDAVLPEHGPIRDYNPFDYVRWKLSEMSSMSRKKGQTYYDGIIVQLPVKDVVDQRYFYSEVPPLKDVDCFHPENVGLVSQGRPRFLPCTPAGIIELLKQSNVPLVARKVAVVNNSDIVGKPLALLLSMEGATVSICHHRSNSTDVKSICRDADIVVVAVGKAHFLDRNYVRAGQTVIDVGVSKVDGKIVGDVHPEVRETVAAVTPCTGGVGPMTVSMLMSNVAEAAYLQV